MLPIARSSCYLLPVSCHQNPTLFTQFMLPSLSCLYETATRNDATVTSHRRMLHLIEESNSLFYVILEVKNNSERKLSGMQVQGQRVKRRKNVKCSAGRDWISGAVSCIICCNCDMQQGSYQFSWLPLWYICELLILFMFLYYFYFSIFILFS